MRDCRAKLGYGTGIRFEGIDRRTWHRPENLDGRLSRVSTHFDDDRVVFSNTQPDLSGAQRARGNGKAYGICHTGVLLASAVTILGHSVGQPKVEFGQLGISPWLRLQTQLRDCLNSAEASGEPASEARARFFAAT